MVKISISETKYNPPLFGNKRKINFNNPIYSAISGKNTRKTKKTYRKRAHCFGCKNAFLLNDKYGQRAGPNSAKRRLLPGHPAESRVSFVTG